MTAGEDPGCREGRASLAGWLRARLPALGLLTLLVAALSLLANASLLVRSPRGLRFIPPFREGVNLNQNHTLGAEYLFVAQRLAAGKGFSSPFFYETGPTAWVAPLYSFLLAGLLIVLGTVRRVTAVVVVLQGLTLVATGMIAYELARRRGGRRLGAVALAFFSLWLIAHFRWFFQTTHDVWLIMASIDAVVLAAAQRWDRPAAGARWGAVGGVGALASPVLAASWLACSLFLAATDKARRRRVAQSLIVFALLLAPWVIRNWAVFDRLIAVKSNLFYDAYHNNYELDSAVIGEGSFATHPITLVDGRGKSEYERLGEAAFMDRYRARFLDAVRRDPGRLAGNAARRLAAALVCYPPYNRSYEAGALAFKSALFVLPTLGLLIVLVAWLRGRAAGAEKLAAVLYLAFLAPYVALSYYARYSLPLSLLATLLVAWGAARIGDRLHAGAADDSGGGAEP